MSVTRVGLYYSIAQSLRRMTIVPHDDSELGLLPPPRTGEGYVEIGLDVYQVSTPDDLNALIRQQTGASATLSDRYVEIESGAVTRVWRLDPAIDDVTGLTLLQNDTAQVGWRYADGVFTAPVGTDEAGA